MFKTLAAAAVAVSLIAGPVLAQGTAPTTNTAPTTTSQPAKVDAQKPVAKVDAIKVKTNTKHAHKAIKHVKHVKHIKHVKHAKRVKHSAEKTRG
jgi:hypothetical protein